MSKIVILLFIGSVFFSCQKRQIDLKEKQEPLSPELSSLINVTNNTLTEFSSADKSASPIVLPPPGPYKPTNKQIQIALRNAGFYTGKIDGVIGPDTTKAIKEFQAQNNLEVDGKVGPKTWEVLSKYLNNN